MKQDRQDSMAPFSSSSTAATTVETKRNKNDIPSAVDKAVVTVWSHLLMLKAAGNADSTVLSEECFADHDGDEFGDCRSEHKAGREGVKTLLSLLEAEAKMVSSVGAL